MKNSILFLFAFLLSLPGAAQMSRQARDSINRLSAEDHALMKKQLAIEVPNRPGPSGNPNAPNAANRYESKVNDYTLPAPLILNNGQPVNKPEDWWRKRRPEIVRDFENEIYGRLPENIPEVTWKVIAQKDTTVGDYPIKEKTLSGIVDNSSYPELEVEIELLVATPANTTEPIPLVLEFGFIRWPWGNEAPQQQAIFRVNEPGWKEQLISKGWGYAIIVPSSIQADHGAGLRSGIIGMVNKGQPRKPNDWGALRAWAWGASKAMDYFETDRLIDENKIAIEGLSRYGKAALVAMAFEPRFSLGFIGSSGAGGAKILRRVFGEQVENLASTGEYHWFCGNFIKYASSLTPDDLPVDAHELVALCAPRPVFISSGSPQVEGQWIDAKGMFLAGVHAGPVYELLEKKALTPMNFPSWVQRWSMERLLLDSMQVDIQQDRTGAPGLRGHANIGMTAPILSNSIFKRFNQFFHYENNICHFLHFCFTGWICIGRNKAAKAYKWRHGYTAQCQCHNQRMGRSGRKNQIEIQREKLFLNN